MIPIRDHNPSNTVPFFTYLLLGINVMIFIYSLTLGNQLTSFYDQFALIPNQVVNGQHVYTLITSMFLHGSFAHILGNMLFLRIFGDNLEDSLGHIGFLAFYLLTGLGASGLQILTDPTSSIPNLGASGAIAGLMGGYLVLFPKHKIDTLMAFGGVMRKTTVPAISMLGYWIIFQFISGIGSLGYEGGGVAYFAHIGGFIAGAVIILLLRPILKR